jgi:hypothetical protein
LTTRTQPLALAARLQRIDSLEFRHLVSETANLPELSSLPDTCSMSHVGAARSEHSGLRTPKSPPNLVLAESRPHHDSMKPKTPKTRQSLRHLDSRASAPRVPKDSDTSAPETQHSTPKRTSKAASLEFWRQEPRRAPNTSTPRTRPPTPRRASSTSTPESFSAEKQSKALDASSSVNRQPLALQKPDTANPKAARTADSEEPETQLASEPLAPRIRNPQHRRLGEPQRIRVPKNEWHAGLNTEPSGKPRRSKSRIPKDPRHQVPRRTIQPDTRTRIPSSTEQKAPPPRRTA